jgi:hypothetical protein
MLLCQSTQGNETTPLNRKICGCEGVRSFAPNHRVVRQTVLMGTGTCPPEG